MRASTEFISYISTPTISTSFSYPSTITNMQVYFLTHLKFGYASAMRICLVCTNETNFQKFPLYGMLQTKKIGVQRYLYHLKQWKAPTFLFLSWCAVVQQYLRNGHTRQDGECRTTATTDKYPQDLEKLKNV